MLNEMDGDDRTILDALLPRVYDELRRIAAVHMRGEGPVTIQPTILVHEAYLRLVGGAPVRWENRRHFYAVAAEAMRRILIDEARRRMRLKRGGAGVAGTGPTRRRVPVSVVDLANSDDPAEIMALDDAIERLQKRDPRTAQVVRLRLFAGLSIAEAAAALGISERTAKREWTFARAWLFRELGDADVDLGPEQAE